MRRLLSLIKSKLINPFLMNFGFKLIRIDASLKDWPTFFEFIKSLGFLPATIIDVGVANETLDLYSSFPKSEILLIEPIEEFEPSLKGICEKYDAQYILKALGPSCGEMTLHVTPDLVGTGAKPVYHADIADLKPRIVPVTTLDTIDAEMNLKAPILLKIDVEGFELEVLKGADNALEKCEVVILETMLIKTREGGNDIFYEYVHFMKGSGFVLYDVIGLGYTLHEKVLGFLDLVFVKEDGMFRKDQRWFNENQAGQLGKDWQGIKRKI